MYFFGVFGKSIQRSQCSRSVLIESVVCVTGFSASSLQTSTHSMQPLQVYGSIVIDSRPPSPAFFFSGSV